MFESFDFFDGASVDWGSFQPDFGSFDAAADFGATDLNLDWSGFDYGGVTTYGSSDFFALTDAGFSDGSLTDAMGSFNDALAFDLGSPDTFGTIWTPTFPYSPDGFNLPNISAGQLIDVAKYGVSAYGAVQSGPKPQTRPSGPTPAGGSTNANVFQSLLSSVGSIAKDVYTAKANIEDTKARVSGKVSKTVPRGAASAITGPRPTVRRSGSVESQREVGSNSAMMLVAALGVGALVLWKA